MKFPSCLIALSTVALATAEQNVTLSVESSNDKINGKGLSAIHFGAGVNGILLSQSPVTYTYYPDTKQVGQVIITGSGPVPYNFTEFGGDLISGVMSEPKALLENSYLTINGSDSVFYSCSKLPYDPYGYLKNGETTGVAIYAKDAPSECEPIKIKAKFDSNKQVASQSSNSTGLITASGSNTAAAGSSYANTTVTTGSTVYTTIVCSSPTTFAYNSKTYTVSEATTLTVEDCGCTASPSKAPESNPSGSSNSTLPVPNVASRNMFGAAAAMAAVIYIL